MANAPDPAHTADHVPVPSTDPAATTDATAGLPDVPTAAVPFAAVSGYQIFGEIARGGMGLVLAARDVALDREVAVKVLLPGKESPAAAARFVTESRITARLQHPGIPSVHALGTLSDGSPFLAMKLIQGRTLAALLASRERERPELLKVFEAICQTVGFAHSKGVIHRDLKPLNVMVGEFGEVQVMDWGLAKELANPERQRGGAAGSVAATRSGACDAPDATQAGQILGTPAYMPPEQARGEPVDARADVFALGGILCEILTGKPPFTGPNAREVWQRAARADLTETFARLRGCGADPELIALAERCLAPSPDERPADGKAVADAVTTYRAGVEGRLRKAETERAAAEAKAAEQRKRRRVLFALFAAVGLLFAGGTGFAWWRNDKLNREREAEKTRQDTNAGAIAILLDQTEAALRGDDIDRAKAPLEAAEKRAEDAGGAARLPEELRSRLVRCRADFDALKAFDAAYDRRFIVVEHGYDIGGMIAGYRATLRNLGVVPGETPPPEAARLIHESIIKDRLLTALDQELVWAMFPWHTTLDSPRLRFWFTPVQAAFAWQTAHELLPLLRAADPDPFRNQLRAAIPFHPGTPPSPLHALLAQPEALAQPGRFTVAVADLRVLTRQQYVAFLDSAFRQNPANWRIGRATADGGLTPELAAETLTWLRASVALRPGNLTNWGLLGVTLKKLGRWDEAEAALREAARRFPQSDYPWSLLSELFVDKGDRPAALAAIHEALARQPGSIRHRRELAYFLQQTGDHAAAAAEYHEILRRSPNDVYARYGLGNVSIQNKDYDAAEKWLRETLALDPKIADAHFQLGHTLYRLDRHAEAIPPLRQAILLRPDFALAHYGLGRVRRAMKDFPGAVAALREAARLDPVHADTRVELGMALRQAGDSPAAVAQFLAAARITPNDYFVFYQLGVTHHRARDYAEAARCYRISLGLKPDHAETLRNLGNALQRAGDIPGAVAEWKKFVAFDPKDVAVRVNIAVYHRDRKEYAEAQKWFREAAALAPADARLRNNFGVTLVHSGKLDEALAEYREAIRLDPDFATPRTNVGQILKHRKDYPGAVAAFREAVRIDPLHAPYRHELAHALLLSGNLKAAVPEYRMAARLDPKSPGRRTTLGSVLNSAGDTDAAIAEFREAARLDPKNWAFALNDVARIHEARGEHLKAAAAYREYLTHRPDDATVFALVGYMLAKGGDLDGAVAAFRESARLKPKDWLSWKPLGDALLAAGDPRGAEEAYRRGSELMPGFYESILARFPLPFVAPAPRPKKE